MQLIGMAVLVFIIWFGFSERDASKAVSAFDFHALVMVVVGSGAAVLLSSSSKTALRTVLALRELVPGLRFFSRTTDAMEKEHDELAGLWRSGQRSAAVALAERSRFPSTRRTLELLLRRAPEASSAKVFLELRHEETNQWQPAINNWDMLSKLGPAFGMVGTITGMIQMFRNMSSDNMNIGSSMSLALLATLYGVAFGAGVAGPIGHFWNGLLDARLGLLERFEKSVNELVLLGLGS
jgi:flagellar motor component MotA